MKSIPFEMMIQILGLVFCYQYQMMIWLWRYLSIWNSKKPFTYLLCYFMKDKVLKDKGELIMKEHISSPKIYYPEYTILLWKCLSWGPYCWILQKQLWQEVLLSCPWIRAFQRNNQTSWYHWYGIKKCYYCEINTILIWK